MTDLPKMGARLCRPHRRSGQALIGLLIAGVLLIALYMMFLGPRQDSNGTMHPSVARQSIDRAREVPQVSYKTQIQQAIDMYKSDNEGKPPASMEELRKYAKDYPPEMWVDPISKKPLVYDPVSGTISDPAPDPVAPAAGAPGTAPNPAAPNAPGGVKIPDLQPKVPTEDTP